MFNKLLDSQSDWWKLIIHVLIKELRITKRASKDKGKPKQDGVFFVFVFSKLGCSDLINSIFPHTKKILLVSLLRAPINYYH